MKYAFYPGCSAESTSRDLHASTLAVAVSLGIELTEPEGWICCGATAAHQTERALSVSLSAANLAMVKDMGLDMVVSCPACYGRMKNANHEILGNSDIRKQANDALGRDYDGSVKVRHFLEVLLEDIGIDMLKKAFKKTLGGLKVASYYGCLLVRPPEVIKFDDPENPKSLDSLITAMGGESIEWPHKVECCGGGLSMTRTDVVVKLSDTIIGMANASGAECITTACPMCQINLDLRQSDIEKETGRRYDMPVVYITQLLGMCLGIPDEELGLEKLMVSPAGILKAVGV
jgi:heterodisulfide reductase subunit B